MKAEVCGWPALTAPGRRDSPTPGRGLPRRQRQRRPGDAFARASGVVGSAKARANTRALPAPWQEDENERNERRRMGTEAKPPREIPGVYNARGEIRQCNEGKYDFDLDDTTDPGKVIFELGVPKYLDTDALDVDVNPLYVRCVVKDKVTQLKLPQEVKVDASKVQRSRTTGKLHIEMPVVDPRPVRGNKKGDAPELEPLKPAGEPAPRQAAPKGGTVSLQGIYKDPRRVAVDKPKELLKEVKTTRTETEKKQRSGSSARSTASTAAGDDDSDDDGIPPLEVTHRHR